jgi:hypothetical protein
VGTFNVMLMGVLAGLETSLLTWENFLSGNFLSRKTVTAVCSQIHIKHRNTVPG